MTRVETIGFCYYKIVGNREKEAAAELERRYDLLTRSHLSSFAFNIEASDAVRDISEKYNVKITLEV